MKTVSQKAAKGTKGLEQKEAKGAKVKSKDLKWSPLPYAMLYPQLVEIARRHGYALALHGSLTRDMDLIAVPWVEDARDPFPMIMEMKDHCTAVFQAADWDDLLIEHGGNFSDKPHGRKAWSLHLTNEGCLGPYIDISVMPLRPSVSPALEGRP